MHSSSPRLPRLRAAAGIALLAACFLAAAGGASWAAEPVDPNSIPTVKIAFYPMAEPSPALKYQLLPPAIVRRPGNAAVHYGKVKSEQNRVFGDSKLQEKIAELSGMPLDKIPTDEARKKLKPDDVLRQALEVVANNGGMWQSLQRAARCEQCDWDLPFREQPFYEILLPEMQESRSFARMLAARARMQIVDGKYDDAVETLQVGYALGRHVNKGPTIVGSLVGIAICSVMDAIVQEAMQRPDAPNLYWALSALPRPLIDMREGFESEMYSLQFSFPELRDLDKKEFGPEHWRHVAESLTSKLQYWAGGKSPKATQQVLTTAAALLAYPRAKAELIRRGRTPAEVEAMPVVQVVLFGAMQNFEEIRDHMFKALYLPYPEGKRHLAEADRILRECVSQRREVIPLASLLLPAVGSAKRAEVRLQRDVAVLRIFEALRMHSAAHGGELPESLKDVTVAAIPLDPARDEPFVYHRLNRQTAILEVIGQPGPGQYFNGVRYEITMKQKGK